jgi:hypothetical protein
MKKIIILSDTGKPRCGLISNLKRLFPECEIQVLPRHVEDVEEDMMEQTGVFYGHTSVETAS